MTHIVIDTDHPSLAGHFPGRPVVPAAVLLEHVVAAARVRHPDARVSGIQRAKFLRQAVPGQSFEIEWGAPGSTLRFACRSGTDVLVQGRITLDHESV